MSVSESDWWRAWAPREAVPRARRELARIEREHVDRLQHAVDGDGGLVDGEAKRLHRLRSQPRCLRRRELAEEPAARSSTGSEADRLGDVEAGGGEVPQRLRRLCRRELRGETRFDGGVVEPSQLLGRRARDGACGGDGLLRNRPAALASENAAPPSRRRP